jgi:heptaprenyl diphosphate synthase
MSVFARNAALIRQKKEIIKMATAGKNNKTTSNRVALYGLLIALAFVLSYIETLFPVYMGAPGVKLGLANLVTVIALYGLGVKEAFAINLVRVILAGFTFGNMASILFGLAGAFLSLLLMVTCKYFRLFDMVGISILGGVAHNIGQFLIAAFVTKTFGVFSYLPVLLIAGTVAGALIGLLGGLILKRISRIL